MSPQRALTARLAPLGLAALALAGCGGALQVQPTAPAGSSKLASRGKVDSPLTERNHLGCLRDAHLAVKVLSPTTLQIGTAPGSPTVDFSATPGSAQAYQIDGRVQSAEVIGSALVYPHQGSDAELTAIESCLAQGVQG
ncbi:MAG: hypothetical protein JO304_10645 [Solirubrobacterales bacterium]|nr:hypothetical protein [Solirubrobacterales bacterium]